MRPLTHSVGLLCATLLLSWQTFAAESGWYAGAAFSDQASSYSRSTGRVPGIGSDAADPLGASGFKIVAGFRMFEWLAVETDYLQLSSDRASVILPCAAAVCLPIGCDNETCLPIVCTLNACADHVRADSRAVAVSALALWPIGQFDLFARAGIASWKTDVEYFYGESRTYVRDVTGTDAKFGAGVQLRLRRVTARLEYERLRFGANAADALSLGLAYHFR
jgi:hypothetical protein